MAEKELKHLVRVANTDLNGHKQLKQSLLKIKGVGFMLANAICEVSGIDKYMKTGYLTDEQAEKLSEIVKNPLSHKIPPWMLNRRKDPETGENKHLLMGDLDFVQGNDIKFMKKTKSYKGLRHQWGLPVRGQKTKSNFRRNKGKVSLGVQRKKTSQKK